MTDKQDFLLEIGSEELPPKALKKLAHALRDAIKQGLEKANLSFDSVDYFAAPRRLAILVKQLDATQADQAIEKRGPALAAAFNDAGEPSKACEGFAKSCGVAVTDLETLETDKGKWLIYRSVQKGETTPTLLPEIVNQAVSKLPIPKPMRWGANETQFIRPVHWIVMLFGNDVVPATVLGKTSGRETVGHRFHHPEKISITNPAEYESLLAEKGCVIAGFETRQQLISEKVSQIAKAKGLNAVVEPGLLDEVCGLVEWPVPLLISFDEDFLRVPSEALIAAMSDHQKCFHVVDEQDKLQAYFITVSNIESKDEMQVIKGNQRVMRARLSDAAFFYDVDLKHGFENQLPKLKHVTYQAKLGSMHDKSVRLATLTHYIAKQLDIDPEQAERAGLLSKCDLVSDMVGEFPELQGTMGRYYAEHENEPEAISLALEEQYFPRHASDDLPTSKLGCALALAERIDTLIGIFGIGLSPTGVKDPFGCRRAALGVVRICVQQKLDLDITDLLNKALDGYADVISNKDVVDEVHQFIIERLKAWYQDKKIPKDAIAAVLARQSKRFTDFDERLNAVIAFRELAEASSLAAANKRVSRLLQKENKLSLTNGIDPALLQDDAERELASLIESMNKQVEPLYQQGNYSQALSELASLRDPVDKFFDDVMVMVEEEDLRNNRLAILAKLRSLFLQVADISLLQ